MNTYGTLIIYIYCVSLQGLAITTARKSVAVRRNVSREEAQQIKDEHAIQVSCMPNAGDYAYYWQADREEL